jgi:hypothetical protein
MYRTHYGLVPAIRLNGNWLAEAGFVPGEKVSVRVEERSLTIQLEARP